MTTTDHMTEAPDPEAYNEALGRTIQVLRTNKGLSRRDLATRSQVSYSYLSAIENGAKPPSSKILTLIARALGVRAFELMAAADARAVEGRLGSDEPDLSTAAEMDRILDQQDLRKADRYAARMALHRERAGLSPTPETELAAMAAGESLAGASRRTELGVIEELRALLPQMSAEDVNMLLGMARRFARGSGR